LPRKTDSNNPTDWLDIAATELEAVRRLAADEFAFHQATMQELAQNVVGSSRERDTLAP
jgi:hypothetical protein